MKRWVAGALAMAGAVLVTLHGAAAQNWEPNMKGGALICGYFPGMFSFAAVHNYAGGARSLCRWKCVYKTSTGAIHVNSGARNVGPGEVVGMDLTKKGITNITEKVSGAGSCVPVKG